MMKKLVKLLETSQKKEHRTLFFLKLFIEHLIFLDMKDFRPTSSVSCLLSKLSNNIQDIEGELLQVHKFQYKNFGVIGG